MLKKSIVFAFVMFSMLSLFSEKAVSQMPNFNLTEVARIPVSQQDRGSDIWGYTDENGREYALFGTARGVYIYDLLDHANPVEVAFVAGNPSIWRDIKTYKNYAYVVMDLSGGGGDGDGLIVMDLSGLPNSIETKVIRDLPIGGELNICHNVFIEEDEGFMYLFGCDALTGGAVIFDLNDDPYNPELVGTYNDNYVHDGFVRGNLMYTSEVYAGVLAVVDVTDKSLPVRLGQVTTSSDFTHNCWLSDDGNYVFTTDERSNAFIDAYDVRDFTDMKLVDKIQSNPGSNVIPHNTFVLNDFLITSYYTDGVTLHDARFPDQLIQVGAYDTSPNFSGDGFDGCWGVYPYFESGYIIAADIQEGLLVLEPNYQLASRVLVNVKDSKGDPINNANVSLLQNGESLEDENSKGTTDLTGVSKLATSIAGDYDLKVGAIDYKVVVIEDVTLIAGERIVVDVVLEDAEAFTANINVIDENNNPVPNAFVSLVSELNEFSGFTNDDGEVNADLFDQGLADYEVVVGVWGYNTNVISTSFNAENTSAEVVIQKGYYDDFVLDFGWTETGNAEKGSWERGVPVATFYQGNIVAPDRDSETDFGDMAYVTGAGTEINPSVHDVDNGNTIITSPTFELADYENPVIKYDYWFADAGGSNNPNDFFIVRLHSGDQSVIVQELTGEDKDLFYQWNENEIIVSEYIVPSNDMRISFETGDDTDNTNFVEAAIDKFTIEDSEAPIKYAFTGVVTDEFGNPVSDAVVGLQTSSFQSSIVSDESGNFSIELSPETYDVSIGKWGFQGVTVNSVELTEGTDALSIILVEGYSDSFDVDLGWALDSEAEEGNWERGITSVSMVDGEIFNAATGSSLEESDPCFSTGLDGYEDANINDVDNGTATLISPVFDLSDYENPHINYSRWFSNGGGTTSPDDKLIISLSNGDETVELEEVSATTEPVKAWNAVNLRVEDYITPTANMTIQASVADGTFDHIVEAAFDAFSVVDSMSIEEPMDTTIIGINDLVIGTELNVSPNPFTDFVLVEISNHTELAAVNKDLELNIYDLAGKLIKSINANANILKIDTNELVAGTYILELKNAISTIKTVKIVKH